MMFRKASRLPFAGLPRADDNRWCGLQGTSLFTAASVLNSLPCAATSDEATRRPRAVASTVKRVVGLEMLVRTLGCTRTCSFLQENLYFDRKPLSGNVELVVFYKKSAHQTTSFSLARSPRVQGRGNRLPESPVFEHASAGRCVPHWPQFRQVQCPSRQELKRPMLHGSSNANRSTGTVGS